MRVATLALIVGCAALGLTSADPAPAPAPAPEPPSPPSPLELCFKQDSISCVQKHVFRSLKAFFEQEKIAVFGGLSLVRAEGVGEGARADAGAEEEALLEGDADVEARESALEAFAARRAAAFLQERSVQLDLSPVVSSITEHARALVARIPPELRQRVVEFAASEARGRRKRLRQLLPLLLLGGLKVLGLGALTFLGVAFIAKKAILVSLVSIAISAFIGLKKLLSQQSHGYHHEVHEAYPVHGGWAAPSYGAAFDVSGYSAGHGDYVAAHSAPVGHAVAYSAHKPGARR